jgi:hypothetical protein
MIRPWSAKQARTFLEARKGPSSSKSPSSKKPLPPYINTSIPAQEKSSKSILSIYGASSKGMIYKQAEN